MSYKNNNTQSYTIKQVAELSGLAESTLRFYETIGLIGHISRDVSSKHRVYSEDNINMVVSIACLNATGMSIPDMRKYLKNRGRGAASAREQVALLEAQKHRLIEEAKNMKSRREYVETKIDYWHAVALGNKKQAEAKSKKAKEIAKDLKLPKELK